MKTIATSIAAVALMAGFAGPASAEMMKMQVALTGAEEVPANTTAGKGMVDLTYDTATKMLTWNGTYSGLTGPETMAHFHGPAEKGKNAPVLVPVTAASSPFAGSATLTDAQAKELEGGMMYFNVHTAAHPGGEIRGQVMK